MGPMLVPRQYTGEENCLLLYIEKTICLNSLHSSPDDRISNISILKASSDYNICLTLIKDVSLKEKKNMVSGIFCLFFVQFSTMIFMNFIFRNGHCKSGMFGKGFVFRKTKLYFHLYMGPVLLR